MDLPNCRLTGDHVIDDYSYDDTINHGEKVMRRMNDKVTEIVFLLDRSGSMGGLESDTIGGFNAFLKKQSESEGKTIVTTVLFDDRYEMLWNGIDASQAKLTNKEYFVRGSTALLDAVGKTILDVSYRLFETNVQERPGKVIFVIVTDGLENASVKFTSEKVKDLIHEKKETYQWEFVFLGANIDATQEAANIGISEDSAYEFKASKKGVSAMFTLANSAVMRKRNKIK
jgi:hypothetical protein